MYLFRFRGVSSFGRALQWHCRGDRFDSGTLQGIFLVMNISQSVLSFFKAGYVYVNPVLETPLIKRIVLPIFAMVAALEIYENSSKSTKKTIDKVTDPCFVIANAVYKFFISHIGSKFSSTAHLDALQKEKYDPTNAREVWEKAARQGNITALLHLSELAKQENNPDKRAEYLKQAAEYKSAKAQLQYASQLLETNKDEILAIKHLKDVIAQSIRYKQEAIQAAHKLGLFYYNKLQETRQKIDEPGKDGNQSLQPKEKEQELQALEAFGIVLDLTLLGNSGDKEVLKQTHFHIANIHNYYPSGKKRKKAKFHFKKAADLGLPQAAFEFASICKDSTIETEKNKAKEYFRKAAQQDLDATIKNRAQEALKTL